MKSDIGQKSHPNTFNLIPNILILKSNFKQEGSKNIQEIIKITPLIVLK
jgi:hypothetical protein